MIHFETKLSVVFNDGVDEAVIMKDLVAIYNDIIIIVPAGFKTDFGSVPWFFSRVIPRVGTAPRAFVLHDYLYRTRGLNGLYTRKECDEIMYQALILDGLSAWRAKIAWAGVRAGGSTTWDQYAEDHANDNTM